jgi:hypothetical protein
MKKLQREKPAKQRKKIVQALESIRQSQKALDVLVGDGLLDDDFHRPNLSHAAHCLNEWLFEYELWVGTFAGQSNPIQRNMELMLMLLWRRSGGKLSYSRKKDDPGTPYGPLVDFLRHTLNAILGNAPGPFGIAKMIARQRRKNAPLLTDATVNALGPRPYDPTPRF